MPGEVRANRDLIRKAARCYHVTNLQVFGSVARGDDGPDSDFDFLVNLDVHIHGLIPVMELSNEIARLLGKKVDVAPRSALAPHVAKQALAEAVPRRAATTRAAPRTSSQRSTRSPQKTSSERSEVAPFVSIPQGVPWGGVVLSSAPIVRWLRPRPRRRARR